MKIILTIVLSLLTFPVHSANVQLHIGSNHASDCKDCNEDNYGIGYRGSGKWAFTGGYYRNSWYRDSFYGGINYSINPHFSLTAAVVTGYNGINGLDGYLIGGELLPVLAAHWRILDKPVSPMLTYIPAVDGGVMLFSLDYWLDN